MTWIDDIKNYWKFWSTRLAAAALFLLGLLEFAPQWFHQAWTLMPAAIQSTLTAGELRIIGIVLVFGSLIARGIKQKKLHEGERDGKVD